MFAEHILKVHYPYGGPHFLLIWHSHDEGNHLIIGRKQATVEDIFHRVLQEHDDAVVKNFLHVDIVAPSLAVSEKYAAKSYQTAIISFWDIYAWPIRKYQETYGHLPSSLKECDNYASRYNEKETLQKDPAHFNCKNCGRGVVPIIGTLESVYLKYRELNSPKQNAHEEHAQISRASLPDVGQALYAITTSFGHHREGLVGNEVGDIGGFEDYLFFYQHPEIMHSTKCNDMVEVMKQEHQAKKKLRDEQLKKDIARRLNDELVKVRSIFG